MEGTMPFSLFRSIRDDIRSVFDRDPAARSTLELLVAYPGLHAIWAHRVEHWFWEHGMKLIARWGSHSTRFFTGIEIHPGAQIGDGFFIDHGMGVVIGETSEIGHNVTIYHGVTLGGTTLTHGKRHPTIEDNVVIGAGAKVLGAIVIGSNSRIGANAVVVKSVPPESVVVGVPGQVVHRSQPAQEGPDLEHGRLPDTLGDSIKSLMDRLEVVESKAQCHRKTWNGTRRT
ncbi:MAG: serine O-acetyltransferase [Rhodopseudomonas palustris]|nr:serine O-acetyltransferase [Rhodopseudomonas palustris]